MMFSSQDRIAISGFLSRSLGRIVGCLDGLDYAEQRWRPAAPNTNSLLSIAWHALANAEENILLLLGGQPAQRDHAIEFDDARLTAADVQKRWRELEPLLDDALRNLPDSALSAGVNHPRRGDVTVFEVLVVALRHAAEHMGQAELTRDLARARRVSDTPERQVTYR